MFSRVCLLLSLLSLLLVACTPSLANEPTADRQTRNVLLITLDGLRWQELFGGADESLMNAEFGNIKGEAALRERFWRDTPEERRQALMPFFWNVIAREGIVYGDPQQGTTASVTNPHHFSYPGYSEILTGHADPRIDSNAKTPNPNVTVLEWLHRRPGFEGRVRAVASWDVFPFIINSERSGIPVNAGWQPLADIAPSLASLDEMSAEMPRYWDNVRYDYFTFRGAQETIRRHRPRVLYVSFGETDDWAHAGRYDLYLDAARRTDDYLRQLWVTLQSLPEYAGKTSLVLTTDHGRGDTRVDWKSHSADIDGCEAIWIALLSPDVPQQQPVEPAVTQSQVAASVAALLGEDFHRAMPQSAPPLQAVLEGVSAGSLRE